MLKVTFLLLFVIQLSSGNKLVFTVTGPGLDPTFTLPVRYFFIRGFDPSGLRVPLEKDKLEVILNCRHQTNTIERDDGVLIYRYKLLAACDLRMAIYYNDELVKKVTGHASLDSCYCPADDWIDQCGMEIPGQIQKDLAQFESIDWKVIRPKLLKTFDNPEGNSLCNYVVKSNRVYRRCYGKHTGFSMFMDNTLLALTRIWKMSDVEFFINLGDWPLVTENSFFPIFSWGSSAEHTDVVLPTYDITESSIEAMRRVSLDMLSVQRRQTPWQDKVPKAFWRGRDSRRERLRLIELARHHPDLINASMTNFFFFRNEMDKYGPKVAHISFHDFFDFKYQLNIDGTVAAYRFPYLLAGDGVVFKQDSPYFEHFYADLKPMQHYIPVKRDLSNLIEKIQWALVNDDKVRKISQNGRRYAEENLMPANILCYHARLFSEFAKKLKGVEVQPDMEPVKQVECSCSTHDEL